MNCRWVAVVVILLNEDATTCKAALSVWLQSVLSHPEFHRHAVFRMLMLQAASVPQLDNFIMDQWMALHQPRPPPTTQIHKMLVLRGPHLVICDAVLRTVTDFLQHPTSDECDALSALVPLMNALPDLRFHLDIERILNETELDPVILRYIVALWEHDQLKIHMCVENILKCVWLHAMPQILEKIIQITWSRLPRDRPLLKQLLDAWTSHPTMLLKHPTQTTMAWETVITIALTHPPNTITQFLSTNNTNNATQRVDYCSIAYAFAATASENILVEFAAHTMWIVDTNNTSDRQLCSAMPPRIASVCDLDHITLEMIVPRLGVPYQGHLRDVHSAVFDYAYIPWWVSWMGYVILYWRLTDRLASTMAILPHKIANGHIISSFECSLLGKVMVSHPRNIQCRLHFAMHGLHWAWLEDPNWKMRFVLAFIVYVPQYQMSLISSTMYWLTVIEPWCAPMDAKMLTSAVEYCLAAIPCSVALKRPITSLCIQNRSTTRSLFKKLRAVTHKAWNEEDVAFLIHKTKDHPDFDDFVWSVFFNPGVPRSIHTTLLRIHPRCSVTNHWCHCMRLHTNRPDSSPPAILGLPCPWKHQSTPMHRFLSQNARPGDMASVLNDLLGEDNFTMRRWVAAASGYKLDRNTIMAMPWDMIICCVLGNVMMFAAQSGFTDLLPDPQQDDIVSRLVRVGSAPQCAVWLLRALIFHSDDTHLCDGCRLWWWRHGESVIVLLSKFGSVLVPCLPRLANRCWHINVIGAETECMELAGSLFFFYPKTEQCI
jgi:hypothetical protein